MYTFIFVDDEDYMLDFFPNLLDWKKYDFQLLKIFQSGREAYKFACQNHVDVIMTDIHMGGFSGIDLCRELLKIKPNIIPVFLSGYQEFEYAHAAIQLHAFDYVLKPVTGKKVGDLLERLREKLNTTASSVHPIEQEEFDSFLSIALKIMEERCGEDLQVEEVADKVYLSPAYFSTLFRQKTGDTFTNYLKRIRLEKATRLLANPVNKVYDISQSVGYRSVHHFYKIFKEYKGITPSEYREMMQKQGDQNGKME